MAQTPVRTGAALLAVVVAAFIAMLIVVAEALVRLVARVNEARTRARHGR